MGMQSSWSDFKQFFVGSNFAESAKPLPSRCSCCIALSGPTARSSAQPKQRRRAPILRNRCCCCRRRQIFAVETSVSPKSRARASQPRLGSASCARRAAFTIQPHSVRFLFLSPSPAARAAVSSFIHSLLRSFVRQTLLRSALFMALVFQCQLYSILP